MNCPNCGTPEKAQVKVCRSCGESYASQDLQELRQLEFLIKETAEWEVAGTVLQPYTQRVEKLRGQLVREKPIQPVKQVQPAPQPVPKPAPKPVVAPPKPAPPREKVPFDQWLLSERNIKIALYAGGLLVLAGLIFIGVNWSRIPGPVKFLITLLITGLMYLGGYLLLQRPAFRIGGIALLGVASGFLTLNFAVLQIYVFGPGGLRADVMWLIASPICLLLYVLTMYWTKSDLFTYISLAALASSVTAVLVVLNTPEFVFLLPYAILSLAVLGLSKLIESTPMADYAYKPLLFVAQGAMILVVLTGIAGWVDATGCTRCTFGSPWLAISALAAGVIFYVTTDYLKRWIAARWVAAFLFVLTFSFGLIELNFSDGTIGIVLMVLALAYLGMGYTLERRGAPKSGAWPLYSAAYVIAGFLTLMSIGDNEDLAQILFGDVVLLAVSAAIHRNHWWVFGAVWLFMLPVYLTIAIFVPTAHFQGLLMGALGLNYMAAGYALGRRELRLSYPFLTAAAALSVVSVVLTWGNPVVATFVLAVIAVLYVLTAYWLENEWLVLPALLAVNLGVVSIHGMIFAGALTRNPTLFRSLFISFFLLGVVLALGGLAFRRSERARWAWPLYLFAVLDLGGGYLVSLTDAGWLAVGISVVFAALLLGFAWLEKKQFADLKTPPILTYLGIGAVIVAFAFLLAAVHSNQQFNDFWPIYMSGLGALFVGLAWLFRGEQLNDIYSTPFRLSGLLGMIAPMFGAVVVFEPFLGAITFAIAGITYAADAAARKIIRMAFLGLGALVVVIWAVLLGFDVSEPQAYAIPLGIALLAMGWKERLRKGGGWYRIPTLLGLLVLMGSAFIQSLEGAAYALVLLVESLVSIAWGIRTKSRGYFQLGIWSLIINAVIQIGPGFLELSGWIQAAVTGSILFGGGLAALFKRDEILAARRRLSEELGSWES